ncbi:MAG TPA: undecaprenyl-diphosphate phosphatase [Candidatus Saccharimonadales bacterium]|nr:undecaprenyl-diphosphate phosphatase [Candidatus Saccharimonadales bacterium]
MSILQAIIIGLAQGVTELFPISSLGHSVIIPRLLGWNIHQNDPYFLTFLVATHLATATVLFVFFWRDWVEVIKGLARSLAARDIKKDDTYAKLGWLLVVATVPAGMLGLLFEQPLRRVFASARIAAAFLILNGCILLMAEKLRKRANKQTSREQSDAHIAKLGWAQAVGIGAAQAGALFPGISRSGASMAGSLLAGLNNEDAARFSFLLATPIIGAAACLKLPELFQPSVAHLRGAIVVGSLCAAVTAFLSVRFLVKYFQTNTMRPFAIYCLGGGAVYSLILLMR